MRSQSGGDDGISCNQPTTAVIAAALWNSVGRGEVHAPGGMVAHGTRLTPSGPFLLRARWGPGAQAGLCLPARGRATRSLAFCWAIRLHLGPVAARRGFLRAFGGFCLLIPTGI